jgi:hypothetical protein
MVTGQLSVLSVSLLTPRSAQKVRPKKSYFSSACEYVKLPSSLRVPKNSILRKNGRREFYFLHK